MISAPQSSTSQLDLILKPPKNDYSACHLVHSLNPPVRTTCNLLTNISNLVYCLPTTTSVYDTPMDDLSSHLLRSHFIIHFGRVAATDCHDTDAWTRKRIVHDTKLNAMAATPFLSSEGAAPDDRSTIDVARNSLAVMEHRAQGVRTIEQFPSATWPREETTDRPRIWTSPVTPGPGIPLIRPGFSICPCSREDLSEDKYQVGEILVRCGVIAVSGVSSNISDSVGWDNTLSAHPTDALVISSVTAQLPLGENDGPLIAALANWTSAWVHTLVIQPYLQGNFRFRFHGALSSTSVALRIRRVFNSLCNPVQVAIHVLWFIGILTANGTHNGAPPSSPFLSIPIFRYLHNNGTSVAEDFMFHTFTICAMIGDKTVNDASLSTNTWNRLTRIPQVILNATEKYTLSCLKWNLVMTRVQWQDITIYLRSCIKMGSAFDPFAYDETSPSVIMARCLDELINLGYADKTHISQQGAIIAEMLAPQHSRHYAHWGILDTAEWCPRDDPIINQKSRAIGIAPGAGQKSNILTAGTTAEDILDSIFGSSNVPALPHFTRPAGTSSSCSSTIMETRLAYTVKIANAC